MSSNNHSTPYQTNKQKKRENVGYHYDLNPQRRRKWSEKEGKRKRVGYDWNELGQPLKEKQERWKVFLSLQPELTKKAATRNDHKILGKRKDVGISKGLVAQILLWQRRQVTWLCGCPECIWQSVHFSHDLFPRLVDSHEHLGFSRQLPLDIRCAEDALQIQPVPLACRPFILPKNSTALTTNNMTNGHTFVQH